MIHVLFIHSAGSQAEGDGSSALLDGLRAALPEDMVLLAPLMPKPEAPEARPWIEACHRHIAEIEGDLILVGHSLGGSILLKTLAETGLPPGLLGVVTLAAPFWGAPDWQVEDFVLPPDAGAKLAALPRLILLQGDEDDIVAPDHPQLYRQLFGQAEIRILPEVDHAGNGVAPLLAETIAALRAR